MRLDGSTAVLVYTTAGTASTSKVLFPHYPYSVI